MATPRIGYARIFQETCAHAPQSTHLSNFKSMHWLEGAELAAACAPGGAEYPGLLKNAELSGFVRAAQALDVQAVPLVSAATLPSGPLTEETYRHLEDALLRAIDQAGELHGLFLSLHGAMVGERDQELDGRLLERVRERLGAHVPIAASLDLHGHLTPGKVAPTPLLCGYHTNPHRDLAATGERAGRVLIDTVRGKVHPTRAWRKLPVVLGGGMNIDLMPPMRSMFNRMKRWQKHPKVLSADVYTMHPFIRAVDAGWAVHVLTHDDQALADQVADDLARAAWRVSETPATPFVSVEQALDGVRKAWLRRQTGVVNFVDASDIIGCGAPGCNTHLLRELLDRGGGWRVYLPVLDAAAAADLMHRTEGTRVQFSLGGKYGDVFDPRIEVAGKLLKTTRTTYGNTAVVDLGDIKLVVTELPPFMISPQLYKELGLPPLRADIVVQKSIFRFLIYWWAYHRKVIPVATSGATDLGRIRDLEGMWAVRPFQHVPHWRERDAAYRGAA